MTHTYWPMPKPIPSRILSKSPVDCALPSVPLATVVSPMQRSSSHLRRPSRPHPFPLHRDGEGIRRRSPGNGSTPVHGYRDGIQPESAAHSGQWMPAFARMTIKETAAARGLSYLLWHKLTLSGMITHKLAIPGSCVAPLSSGTMAFPACGVFPTHNRAGSFRSPCVRRSFCPYTLRRLTYGSGSSSRCQRQRR